MVAFRIFLLMFVSVAPNFALAQTPTLDEKAWNSVWDRYEGALNFNLQPGESLQILNYPVPAAWGEGDKPGLLQLESIAGIIPKQTFALDPSANDKKLFDTYR